MKLLFVFNLSHFIRISQKIESPLAGETVSQSSFVIAKRLSGVVAILIYSNAYEIALRTVRGAVSTISTSVTA
jgi:hypothetical protein